MCRITGIAFKSEHFSIMKCMTKVLAHGGPDAQGVWHDDQIAFGHRRLAILELSDLGHQPMLSASGRYVITYNGEIYNFKSLKQQLSQLGYSFKGGSDTEVILAAVESWGVDQALTSLNGMFAFALWDRLEKKLYLARDRFGEKPLYYGIVKGAFIFASELKALKLYPDFEPKINQTAVQLLLRYAYIQAPHSIYEGVFKLEPGHYLCVDSSLKIEKHCYWSALDAALHSKQHPTDRSFMDCVDELETRLLEAVRNRCISDVPLGAFLSGGVDSSTIVAMMQKISDQPVKTFSIGFESAAYDEAPFARAVAQHLGTEHYEFYVLEQDALNVIPRLATIYDEPFADSSQIPTYLVSQLAKQHVTVALSGDTGDELFGGYQRYFAYDQLQRLHALPGWLKKAFAMGIRHIRSGILGPRNTLRASKLSWMLEHSENAASLYDMLISQNYSAHHLLRDASAAYMTMPEISEIFSPIEKLMLWDTISYLPHDILTKVDRASMAVALEARVPFLDHELFEFVWSLPLEFKVQKNKGKILLKQVLYRYVPKQLIDRPKAGFGIPIHDWLRGPLKEWAGDLIASAGRHNILNTEQLESVFKMHLSGRANVGHQLWNALILQDWLNQQ
jgi:asparagine synthase (glutamine-hydrolysing)